MLDRKIIRAGIYLIGLFILALGIILNSKSNLGVSAIISVAYSISVISNSNFGDVTFLLYCVFVVMEMAIHVFQSKHLAKQSTETINSVEIVKDTEASTNKNPAPAEAATTGAKPTEATPSSKNPAKSTRPLRTVLLFDILQVPFSLVFTRIMNVFSASIPEATDNFPLQLLVLLIGIICTGVGAAMVLNMRIIPNPGDGIVQAIADLVNRPVGFTKNCFDLCNVCITASIGLIFAHQLVGIGLGTIVAVIGVGRVIAVFNRLFKDRILTAAGL